MRTSTLLPVDRFLPYMRDVVRCEQSLRELNLIWRMIESSAKLNCPVEAKNLLPTMAATREGFDRLEQDLVSGLIAEKVATVLDEIGTKARYVIDIVVRNLYERTADVGFLATDKKLCEFVAGQYDKQSAVRLRLRAYRRKYTVYDEIILLDTEGNVLVQIDETTPLEGSTDPLIAQTLATDNFVETFRASDLRPARKQALIYSRRMRHPDTGAIVGILCLCFNFEQEMAGIFQSHGDPCGRAVMMLLDRDNRVIESSNALWVPLGAMVPVNQSATPALLMFCGRQYLACTISTQGYQGYPGPPGWQGQVMMPLDVAFTGRGSSTLNALDPAVASGLLSHAQTFSPPLFKIMTAVETIQRVVWNGQVMTAGKNQDALKLKAILKQISETGARSNALFSTSITDLYETVLACSLQDAEFVSNLLVDLLDRNLYERAADCRWWALTPDLRSALLAPTRDAAVQQHIGKLLEYINRLYTVYTQIFVYGSDGCILAASQPDAAGHPVAGTCIDASTLAAVLALPTEQDYYVSPFTPTSLYDQRPTYVYHAAIRHPDDDTLVLGGIGIVFDAEAEFLAMLRGGLGAKADAQAMFVDRSGRVLSSTDPGRPVGSMVSIDPTLLSLPNGKSGSRIVLHDGQYAIMGCSVSCGYREFKVSDGYREDVLALVFASFGAVCERPGAGHHANAAMLHEVTQAGSLEFATFFVNGTLVALPAEHVLEARPASKISTVSQGNREARLGLLGLDNGATNQGAVWVYDLGDLMHNKPGRLAPSSQVVIVRHGEQTLGLLVDALHGVPEFNASQLMPNPFSGHANQSLVKQLIKANDGQLLIHLVDLGNLVKLLGPRDTVTL